MRAIVFTEKNVVSIKNLPNPHPADDEVVVEVHASGICGTDFEVLHGNYGSSKFPVVPGHEYAGVIIETGANVNGIKVGDRVVVDPNFECGQCRSCQKGWTHLCKGLKAYGVTHHGGFAERSLVKSPAAHPIGDMPFEIAALAEPMACVLNGLDAARAVIAQNALIFGAGPIGLLLAIGMHVQNVEDIYVVDLNQGRLDFARSMGFNPILANSYELEVLRHGMDLVVDATGAPTVAANLTNYIADGGVGSFFGVSPSDATIEIRPFELFRRQLSLVGSHSLNHNIPEALDIIRSFGHNISRLTTHKMSLEQVAEVLKGNPPKDSMKIQWGIGL